MLKLSKIFTVVSLCLLSQVAAEMYEIDQAHSSVYFKVRHMGISTVTGNFNEFSGTIDLDTGDVSKTSGNMTIQAASIDTRNKKRDGHLNAPDFFDTQKYPTIEFKSTRISDVNGDKGKLHGDLSMHGVTKPIVLDIELTGKIADRIGFTASGLINRTEYGLTWTKLMETGGVVVAEEVKIGMDIEAVKKNPEQMKPDSKAAKQKK